MLRVATTVRDAENRRATGTYIPAIQPDGTANPVIAAILGGTTYHGRAYVVNDWYLTAYEPMRDAAGHLVGMLYVGVRQQAVAERIRQEFHPSELIISIVSPVLGVHTGPKALAICGYNE